MTAPTPQDIRLRLLEAMGEQQGQPCFLCDAPGDYVGVFQPNKAFIDEHCDGKPKLFCYSICRKCRDDAPNSQERIEDGVITTLKGMKKWQ